MKLSKSVYIAILAMAVATPALSQGYTYAEVPPTNTTNDAIFGFAAFKICQIKMFLFSAVYVLGAIAFVVFAIKSIFTKFEMKQFIPIIAALFVVATADLMVSFFSTQAFYCPTVFSSF